MKGVPTCPLCGAQAATQETRYGRRHSCCGLHSWDGKPLVSPEVHAARISFHNAFDPIWKAPGRKGIRNKAYHYLAHVTGLPESECHGATQTDIEILRRLTEVAQGIEWRDVKYWTNNDNSH